MILNPPKLLAEDNPLLRTRAVESPFETTLPSDAERFEAHLIAAMKEFGGIGLAAPQIGWTRRVFVMGDAVTGYTAYFNPIILKVSQDTNTDSEGCLSFPNLVLDIERYSAILVRYSNSAGKQIETELSGLWARCFQHELDHLDGICFDTRVSRLALGIARRKSAKAAKRMKNGR